MGKCVKCFEEDKRKNCLEPTNYRYNQSQRLDVCRLRANYTSEREKAEGQEVEMDLPYRITQVYSTSVNQHSPRRGYPFPYDTNCYGSLTECLLQDSKR